MDFLNMSFRVGRLFDITIRIHILFLLYIAFRLFQAGSAWPQAIVFLTLLFGIVLIHEFGHCFGARSVGGDARDILMWPLGGLAFAHAPMTPWAQFVTVACGPLVNLVFCLVSGAIVAIETGSLELILLNPFGGIYSPPALDWLGCTWIFYQVNLLLLGFNLLPVYPLDGGQLFQCLLWPFVGLQDAMRIACQVGVVGCVLLGFWGLTTDGGQMLIFIAIFGGFTSWQRLQALKYGMVVDERVSYASARYDRPRESFWKRLFGSRRRSRAQQTAQPPNPNPGAWERKLDEEDRTTQEVDRILKKVRESGIQSLSYVERQTLERATREFQRRERDFERQNRV